MGDRESPSSCLFVSDLPSDITEKVSSRPTDTRSTSYIGLCPRHIGAREATGGLLLVCPAGQRMRAVEKRCSCCVYLSHWERPLFWVVLFAESLAGEVSTSWVGPLAFASCQTISTQISSKDGRARGRLGAGKVTPLVHDPSPGAARSAPLMVTFCELYLFWGILSDVFYFYTEIVTQDCRVCWGVCHTKFSSVGHELLIFV